MAKSPISWTEQTWNPVVGCTKIAAGCKNCYAHRLHQKRHIAWTSGRWPDAPKQYHRAFSEIQLLADRLEQPLHWRKPRRIFVNSMSDLFHEDVPFAFIDKVFTVMDQASQHTYQILTKRPERMLEYMRPQSPILWEHVHFGVSCATQKDLDKSLAVLMQIPAAFRFVSLEPLLEAVNWYGMERLRPTGLHDYWQGLLMDTSMGVADHLHAIIVGCESGPKRRPCKLEWIRSIVDQCREAGVACHVKQVPLGRINPKTLKYWTKVSRDPSEWPEDVRTREY